MVSRFCDLRVLNNSFEFTIKVFLSPGDYIFRKKLVLNYVGKKRGEVQNSKQLSLSIWGKPTLQLRHSFSEQKTIQKPQTFNLQRTLEEPGYLRNRVSFSLFLSILKNENLANVFKKRCLYSSCLSKKLIPHHSTFRGTG